MLFTKSAFALAINTGVPVYRKNERKQTLRMKAVFKVDSKNVNYYKLHKLQFKMKNNGFHHYLKRRLLLKDTHCNFYTVKTCVY